MIELLIGVSTAVNRIVEVVKRYAPIVWPGVDPQGLKLILLVVQVALSVIFAVGMGLNAFAENALISSFVGQIFTGLIVATGAEGIHKLFDLISKKPAQLKEG